MSWFHGLSAGKVAQPPTLGPLPPALGGGGGGGGAGGCVGAGVGFGVGFGAGLIVAGAAVVGAGGAAVVVVAGSVGAVAVDGSDVVDVAVARAAGGGLPWLQPATRARASRMRTAAGRRDDAR